VVELGTVVNATTEQLAARQLAAMQPCHIGFIGITKIASFALVLGLVRKGTTTSTASMPAAASHDLANSVAEHSTILPLDFLSLVAFHRNL